jgi:regulator of sigma E protease
MKITVDESSYYARQGFVTNDSIIAANGISVTNWEDVWEVVDRERNAEVNITVVRDDGSVHDIYVLINEDSAGIAPLVPPIAGALKQNSPADKAGMEQGDTIVAINATAINSWAEMVSIVRTSQNTSLQFIWVHKGDTVRSTITPEPFYDPIEDDTIGQIGVFMPHGRTHVSAVEALVLSAQRTTEMIYRVLEIFYQLITRQIPARQLGGPIAIFRLSTESAQWGFEYLLGLLAIISVNLGLINLFPIPALDGGHIIIAAIEAIRHKRFSSRTRLIIQQVGYALIFLLIIFVTFNDITR